MRKPGAQPRQRRGGDGRGGRGDGGTEGAGPAPTTEGRRHRRTGAMAGGRPTTRPTGGASGARARCPGQAARRHTPRDPSASFTGTQRRDKGGAWGGKRPFPPRTTPHHEAERSDHLRSGAQRPPLVPSPAGCRRTTGMDATFTQRSVATTALPGTGDGLPAGDRVGAGERPPAPAFWAAGTAYPDSS